MQDHKTHWATICTLADIWPSTGVAALVNGRQIAVFRLPDDRVFAIDNHDPNSGANVLARGIVGSLGDRVVVASPIYKHHYCLASGECLEDPETPVRAYPVRVSGGTVEVSV